MSGDFPILNPDAIREAVFEIRFDRSEDAIPEIFVGKIADFEAWRPFKQVRLPFGELPEFVRQSDPNLQHKASVELVSADGQDAIQIGPDVLSLHRRGEYQGWDGGFGPAVEGLARRLFEVFPNARITRLGLRYVNALEADAHGVRDVSDLQVEVRVADVEVRTSFNINFKTDVGTDFEAMNRLATVDFAGGNIPEKTTVVLDIDVYTSADYQCSSAAEIISWARLARDKKNERFFRVLGPDLTRKLAESHA